jgi:adenosyl cobinamide kinase/adenosyl cobinamide phosphate guanylyltransferase
MSLTFLVGGARSGKSTLAVQMGMRHGGRVHFIATAEPFDDDMRDRVARHRAQRPATWTTAEVPVELAASITDAPTDAFVIVDCLTVWLANLLVHVIDPLQRTCYIDDMVAALGRRQLARGAPTVVVSNEVGMGVHPATPVGREYRDDLGHLNQLVASVADRSLLLVAGRAMRLQDPWELFT